MRSGNPGLISLLSFVHLSKVSPTSPVSAPLPTWDIILPWLVQKFHLEAKKSTWQYLEWKNDWSVLISTDQAKAEYCMELEATWDFWLPGNLLAFNMNRQLKFPSKNFDELFFFPY